MKKMMMGLVMSLMLVLGMPVSVMAEEIVSPNVVTTGGPINPHTGANTNMAMWLGIAGAAAVGGAGAFFFMKKKDDDEEEEEKPSEDTSSEEKK